MRKANQKAGKRQMAKVLRSYHCPHFHEVSIAHNPRLKHFCLLPFAICLLPCLSLAARPPLEELKSEVRALVDSRSNLHAADGRLNFQLLRTRISGGRDLGLHYWHPGKGRFQITRGVAGMPTAFVATWGSGKPVIGFMADIDGLPETSQKPGVPRSRPADSGRPWPRRRP